MKRRGTKAAGPIVWAGLTKPRNAAGNRSAPVAQTLLLDLSGAVGIERVVEARPTLFGIGRAPRGRIDPVGPAQDCLGFRIEVFLDAGGDGVAPKRPDMLRFEIAS